MRFAISFGIDKSDWIQNAIVLGARWDYSYEKLQWVEIYIIGFRFYFSFEE